MAPMGPLDAEAPGEARARAGAPLERQRRAERTAIYQEIVEIAFITA